MKPWWVQLLAKLKSIEGGWLPLSKAIDAANPQASHNRQHIIDKGTLRRLCEGRDPQLSLSHLKAIDNYLGQHNLPRLSQRPLFEHTISPLSLFPHGSRIAIVVGARYLEKARTEVISRHDVRAMSHFYTHPIVRDCFTHHHDILKRVPLHLNFERSRDDWSRLLERIDTQNIVTIGSPLANRATEHLLCEITGAKPFEKSLSRPLPVRFLMPSANGFRSAFFVTPNDLQRLRPKPDLNGFDPERNRAIIVGEQVFLSKDEQVQQRGEVYSVLLMARARQNRGVHACVIGTSGPATVGLATLMTADNALDCPSLPLRGAARSADRVLIAVIRTQVGIANNFLTGETLQDPRQVGRSEVAMPPVLFARGRTCWRKV